ncbi:MAG: glycosyltransferase family 4 protein [Clostridia bacterium]|nr:glycosyltransferase family 4 protein [Clostridia bacterium]
MVKIAFVCQRYGLEVNGGSELHCRQLAEKLAALYDVTVYTTCALDYTTWANHYAEGEETINGIKVKRYPVAKGRVQESFDRISAKVFSGAGHSDAEEKQWLEEQGPYCPAVLEAVAKEHGEYRAVFFMTYLYYLTATGLPMGFPNAMLIPTVHDEPPVYLRHYEKVFAAAKRICWNTEVEKAFATKRFPVIRNTPGIMVGVGIDGPQGELPELPEELRGKRYLVYAGRIDESKGCGEMFDFFLRLKKEQKSDLKLVLMGKPVMKIPEHPDIIPLGFVSEEMKFAVMKEAFALVLCSRFESLSMVVLESMLMGRPVLVTEKCAVLKEHCIRSGAGLYFDFYQEFAGCVRWMEEHPEAYQTMRESGVRYVKENYSWDVITEKYHAMIDGFGKE